MQIGQLIRARDLLGRVAREHRAVAVRVRRIRPDRTRRAAFRIRFADHDGHVRQLRKGRDDGEAVVDRAELIADAHPHEAGRHHLRRALRVEGHEIERRSRLARRVVRAAQAVLEEIAQDRLRPRAVGTRHFRSADPRRRHRALQPVGREVVELHVLVGRAVPVADVRLVPDFEPPALDLAPSVLLDRGDARAETPARPTWRSPPADRTSRCRCRCSCRRASRNAGTAPDATTAPPA